MVGWGSRGVSISPTPPSDVVAKLRPLERVNNPELSEWKVGALRTRKMFGESVMLSHQNHA